MNPISKFFLGITLPTDLEAQWEKWRRKFRASRTVVHLTLIPPFTWEDDLESLLQLLQNTLKVTKPFVISGEGIGSFGTRVIFIKVASNQELSALHKALAQTLGTRGVPPETRPYHPHITLASRLEPRRFHRYLEDLEGFYPSYSFTCNEIALFQFEEAIGWHRIGDIPLG